MKKTISVFIYLVVLTTTITGCMTQKWTNQHPSNQPNTTWETEDEKVSFTIEDNSELHYGTIKTNAGEIKMVFEIKITSNMILGKTINYDLEYTEQYRFSDLSEDTLWVEIVASDHYPAGERILFNKTT